MSGYYWRVRAFDAAENPSAWSETRFFIVTSPLNAAPDRNFYSTSTLTLSWNGVSWAVGYEVEVDNNPNFSSPEYVNRSLGVSAQSDTASLLSEDRVYYWRVGAKQPDGSIVWSMPQTFTVDIP